MTTKCVNKTKASTKPYKGSALKSSTDSVPTPPYLIAFVKKTLGLGDVFDPCPLNPQWDPKKHANGLNIPWKDVSFVNPPYSQTKRWFFKAHNEFVQRRVRSILLVKTHSFVITNKKGGWFLRSTTVLRMMFRFAFQS